MNNKCKQVKEVGINPDFETAQAGNPLCHACGAEEGKKPRGRSVKIGVEKHIRITDVSMTEMINALVNHPDGGNFTGDQRGIVLRIADFIRKIVRRYCNGRGKNLTCETTKKRKQERRIKCGYCSAFTRNRIERND